MYNIYGLILEIHMGDRKKLIVRKFAYLLQKYMTLKQNVRHEGKFPKAHTIQEGVYNDKILLLCIM